MTTELQASANASNATRSTGPRTEAGKGRASKNALRHGLRSEQPVLPGERAEDWQAHHDGIVESLAPTSGLEAVLAARVALCARRLRRVAAYETAVTVQGVEQVKEETRKPSDVLTAVLNASQKSEGTILAESEKELQEAKDRLAGWEEANQLLQALPDLADDAPVSGAAAYDVLTQLIETADDRFDGSDLPDPGDDEWPAELGVPEDEVRYAYDWSGWTAGMVRLGWEQIAGAAKATPEKLLGHAIADRHKAEATTRERVENLGRKVKTLRRRIKVREQRQCQRRMLPEEATLNKITRYEAHLTRQMLQALHALERLQAARAGQAVPPPAVLDVTVDAEAGRPVAGEMVPALGYAEGA